MTKKRLQQLFVNSDFNLVDKEGHLVLAESIDLVLELKLDPATSAKDLAFILREATPDEADFYTISKIGLVEDVRIKKLIIPERLADDNTKYITEKYIAYTIQYFRHPKLDRAFQREELSGERVPNKISDGWLSYFVSGAVDDYKNREE